jgi:hypothetical protein
MLAVEVDEAVRRGLTAAGEASARDDELVVEIRAVSIIRMEAARG